MEINALNNDEHCNNIASKYAILVVAYIELSKENAKKDELIASLESEKEASDVEKALLKDQVARLQKQLYGSKSEKIVEDLKFEQLELFDSKPYEQKPEEQVSKEITVERHKRKIRVKNGWNELPPDLPVEEEILDVPPEERVGMVLIGYEETERLACRRTSFFIKIVKRAKYAHPKHPERGVVIASKPEDFFNSPSGKTHYDSTVVSKVIADKIENHIPLYRQAEQFRRENVPISRSTLLSLYTKGAQLLKKLYNLLGELIDQCPIIHGDETTVKLLVPGRGKSKTAYMWVKMTGLGPRLVYFLFADSRKKEVAEELYANFSGTIVRDNYAGYADLSADHAGCWAHVRRHFFEANEAGYPGANLFLGLIRALYQIEKTAKDAAVSKGTEQALFAKRKSCRKTSKGIVDRFFDECRKKMQTEIPTTPLAKAIAYALNQEEALKKFLADPKINIDNNPAENIIRPIALGRKNWLFAGSEGGGENLAILESFVATCHLNGVNFYKWLDYVLNHYYDWPAKKIVDLLPHNLKDTLEK